MENLSSHFCVKIVCVIPTNSKEAKCTEDLILAMNYCQEHNFNVVSIPENDCFKLAPSKESVFVIAEFDSPLFEFLQGFNCTVVGPQCLLDSLNNGQPIPTTAVFNLSMKGVAVTTTGLTMQEIKEIEMKMQFMGGIYTPMFTTSTTHLIAKSVADFGLKFKAARSKAIPIMTPKWINDVWDARTQGISHGNDPKFSSYVSPVFRGFSMCVSQISPKERESIKKIFEANGGKYSATLKKGETNVLVTNSTEGEKYAYARSWKIFCVKPEWVQSSLNQGYVCDMELFTVEKIATLPPKCSTPKTLPDHCSVVSFCNDSVNSTIFNNNSSAKEIDETNESTLPLNQQCDPRSSTEPLECLDLVLSLKAGPFLGGFNIFLSGFDGPQMEKLRRVLKNAGAVQLNTINDSSISHVIVGKTVKEDRKQFKQLTRKPFVVTLEWLIQSLRRKTPAPEEEYLPPNFENLLTSSSKKSSFKDPSSELLSVTTSVSQDDVPVTQQHLNLSQQSTVRENATEQNSSKKGFSKEPTLAVTTSVSHDDLPTTQQYLNLSQQSTVRENATEQNNNCVEEKDQQVAFEKLTTADQTKEEGDGVEVLLVFSPVNALFSGETFQLVSLLDADSISSITNQIESNGGRVVAYGGKYKVTEPLIHAESLPDESADQASVVNTFWIEDCIDEDCIVEVEIYHLPIKVQNRQVFAGCVVSFSGIQVRLMDFLEYLINGLGGKYQKSFSRKMSVRKLLLPSTHLVCNKAEGKKYEKAIEWGIPAVNVEFIIACASSSIRLKEIDFPPEPCEIPTLADHSVPTPTTVVKISRPSGGPAIESSSIPILLPNVSFDAPSPNVLMGPPLTPAIFISPSIDQTDRLMTPVFLLPTSNGTNTFGISPTPRPALSNMPTPETPYGRLLNPDPSPNTRKMWKHAIDNRVRLTPNTDDSPSVSPAHQSERDVLMSGATDYFERLHQKLLSGTLETRDAANDECTTPLPVSTLPPFHDLKVFIGQDIGSEVERSEIMKIVRTLGGQVCLEHSREVTHFVCQGELAASEEMRNAKGWIQIFVSPQWILDCEDTACRLKEIYYQPSLNIETAASSDVAPVSSGLLKTTNDEPLKLLDKPHVEEKALQVEQSVSHHISLSNDPVAIKDSVPDDVTGNLDFVPAPLPYLSFASVSRSLNQSQKLNASRCNGNMFRIMFTGMFQEDRDGCVQIIEKLGGIVVDEYDATCTHLVVSKLECTIKLMTSVAAGKWIVHPGWIAESEDAYRFVDERKFEWGNPTSNDSISKEETRIAAAAYYWRTSRNRGLTDGPFQGISAVLHIGKKNDVFQQLLEAGGGKVVAPELALENDETNLCVLDSREVSKIDLPVYASKGIYCVPPTYFRDLILALDKKLQWAECVLPEFLPYLDVIPSSSF